MNTNSRRDFSLLLSRALGLGALSAIFAQSCKTLNKKNDSNPPKKAVEAAITTETKQTTETESKTFLETTDTQLSSRSACHLTQTFKLDLDRIPPIGDEFEDLTPEFRSYGYPSSHLFCFELPKYQRDSLSQYWITNANGDLILQKTISNHDFEINRTLKVQIFDSLPLKRSEGFVLVFQRKDKLLKFVNPTGLLFSNKFRDKDVVSYSNAIPNEILKINTAHPEIIPQFKSNDVQIASQDLILSKNRNYLGSPALKDFIITDLMGRVLSETGETFQEFLKFPFIVAYKLSGELYVRSIIRCY